MSASSIGHNETGGSYGPSGFIFKLETKNTFLALVLNNFLMRFANFVASGSRKPHTVWYREENVGQYIKVDNVDNLNITLLPNKSYQIAVSGNSFITGATVHNWIPVNPILVENNELIMYRSLTGWIEGSNSSNYNPNIHSIDANTSSVRNQILTINYTIYQLSKNPTISNFNNILKTFSDSQFLLTDPTSDSSGSFSYSSSNTAVATVSGRTVTIVGSGVTSIIATQAETENYSSGTITSTLTVKTFTAPSNNITNIAIQFKNAGYTINQMLKHTDFSVNELKKAGYNLNQTIISNPPQIET